MNLVTTSGREYHIIVWIVWLLIVVVVLLQPSMLPEYGTDSVIRGTTVVLADTPGYELFPWWPRVRWRKHTLAAYRRWRGQGETLFNESAFNRGKSLYDGLLDGRPFRSVAKTFQVKTWLDMRRRWAGLDAGARRALADVLPAGHGLDRDD